MLLNGEFCGLGQMSHYKNIPRMQIDILSEKRTFKDSQGTL